MSGRNTLQLGVARALTPLLRRVCGDLIATLVGLVAGLVLVTGLVVALARHVDYDWDSEFVALHDRWDAEGVKPGDAIPAGQTPPPATDW